MVNTTSLYARSNTQSEATRELRDGLLMYGKQINDDWMHIDIPFRGWVQVNEECVLPVVRF